MHSRSVTFIPDYDVYHVWIMPWAEGFGSYGWVMLMGFLVAAACGLVGVFLVLRRMALMGDAMSHSVLPGIVIAFLLSGSRSSGPMALGAVVAGLLTASAIELVHRNSRLKADAALAVVFSSAFAIGVLLLSFWADSVDLDLDCVLFGEIAFVPLAAGLDFSGISVPWPVVRMAAILVAVSFLLVVFYKELVLSSFDSALARALGIPVMRVHYALMAALAFVVVGAFEAVGAILVIAMLILPMATARFWVERLPSLLWSTLGLSVFYATLGLHLALYLDASIAASMAVVAFILFLLSWVLRMTTTYLFRRGGKELNQKNLLQCM